MDLISDTDLIDFKATREGKTLPFERLFRKYYSPLCNYCQGIVVEKEIGEDIVQDVFVYLWNNRETISIKTSIKAYLYSSVRHGALAYLKKQTLERVHSPRLTEFITYLQESEYSEEELSNLEEAQKILQELPEQCRTVFLMNCIDGKRYKEIAEELNISINTVKTHLSKAYRIFRERLQSSNALFLIVMVTQNKHRENTNHTSLTINKIQGKE